MRLPIIARSASHTVFVCAIVCAALLAACSSDKTTGPKDNEAVAISISPTSATLAAGATQLFTASVTNGSTNTVTWTASGGTLTGSGNSRTFTAPASAGSYTVKATSVDDPSKSASASVTVTAPPVPVAVSISPSSATAEAGGTVSFSATVTGSSNTSVTWSASAGTIAGNGNNAVLTAPATGGTVTVTATSSADASKSASATVTVSSAAVSVTPDSAAAEAGATVSFSASVTGSANTSVTWTTSGGTINADGNSAVLTTPVTGGAVTVTATSSIDASKSASATVTVSHAEVSVSASESVVSRSQQVALTASVTGIVDKSLSWGATCGTISGTGMTVTWTAPAEAVTCTVTAASTADPARKATVELVVRGVYLVTALDDTDDAHCTPAHCSLREALNAALAGGGGDTIRIALPTTGDAYGRRAGSAATARRASDGAGARITLTSALPVINKTVHIIGPGRDALTIDAAASAAVSRRIFDFSGGKSSVTGLTLTGGYILSGNGGAIRIGDGAEIALTDVMITGNQTNPGDGGALAAVGSKLTLSSVDFYRNHSEGPAKGNGGAIRIDDGTLTIDGGTFRENSGYNGGALYAINSPVAVSNASFINDSVVSPGSNYGGAIYYDMDKGSLTLNSVQMTGNAARYAGGGIFVATGKTEITITNSVFSRNTAVSGSGSIFYGGGAIARRGGTGASLIKSSQFLDNESPSGGGAMVLLDEEALRLENVYMAGNRSRGTGGAVYTNAPFEIINSTFSQNVALPYEGASFSAGGAIVSGSGRIVSSTFSFNSATSGGGAIFGNGIEILNSTFVGNSSTTYGGAVGTVSGGTYTIQNSLFAGNTSGGQPSSCATAAPGTVTSLGNNLSDDNCGAFTASGDKRGMDAKVDMELKNNGGPTLTHALLQGSPAIDAANSATCPATDQRGAQRVGTCDIGAFEFGGTPAAARAARILAPGKGTLKSPPGILRPGAGPVKLPIVVPPPAGR